jgi:hypothetical protein
MCYFGSGPLWGDITRCRGRPQRGGRHIEGPQGVVGVVGALGSRGFLATYYNFSILSITALPGLYGTRVTVLEYYTQQLYQLCFSFS